MGGGAEHVPCVGSRAWPGVVGPAQVPPSLGPSVSRGGWGRLQLGAILWPECFEPGREGLRSRGGLAAPTPPPGACGWSQRTSVYSSGVTCVLGVGDRTGVGDQLPAGTPRPHSVSPDGL